MISNSPIIESMIGTFTEKVRIPNNATAEQILPYLKELDISKNYSNFGELQNRYLKRLRTDIFDDQFHLSAHSNCTQALISSILAVTGFAKPDKKICLMPSYTFFATVSAAMSCGYEPYFVDINETDLLMDIESHYNDIPWEDVGLILPTCAYGIIGHLDKIVRLSEQHGIPIVIDGAASFDTLPSDFPLGKNAVFCMSTHATKSFNSGEGGLALTKDPDVSNKIRIVSNFGLDGSRVSKIFGTNSKMSEYHAAVGLANLDLWADHRSGLEQVRQMYIDSLQSNGQTLPKNSFTRTASLAKTLIIWPDYQTLGEKLKSAKIDTRLWYATGLHENHQFRNCRSTSLETTNRLAPAIVGLPCHLYLTKEAIEYVTNSITA